MITEQDLPCIGASIFNADTYASSKPTSLGYPHPTKESWPSRSGVDAEVKTSYIDSAFLFLFFVFSFLFSWQEDEIS